MFALIITAFLVACQAMVLALPPVYQPVLRLPPATSCLPLGALAVFWCIRLCLKDKRRLLAVRVLLWFVFGLLALGSLLETEFSAINLADRPRAAAPVSYGDNLGHARSIAVVYHPGGSSFPREVVTGIAASLARRGFHVKIVTAHPRLALETKDYAALVLASPVYFGAIRPPLADFIARTDLAGVRCFLVTMGKVTSSDDLQKAQKLIEAKGAIFLGGLKAVQDSPPLPEHMADRIAQAVPGAS